MNAGFNEDCLAHDPGPRHPESPERLRAVKRALHATHGASFAHPDPASPADLRSVHDDEYVDEIRSFMSDGGGSWDADTVVTPESWDAVLAAAGLATWAATEPADADAPSDVPFALTRPPGHHATIDDAMGFCVFNNAAVGAQAALDGEIAERVAIIDWDVHHGNGTEDIFYRRDDVAVASIHQRGLYPGTGRLDDTGAGPGEGSTLNLPLDPGAPTATYVRAFGELVLPWLRRQQPDLCLVSAGFDAHERDPISQMAMTTEGYGLLTDRLLQFCDGIDAHVGFVLEGGYDLEILADCVVLVAEVCGGYDPVDPDGAPRDVDRDRIAAARRVHGIGS